MWPRIKPFFLNNLSSFAFLYFFSLGLILFFITIKSHIGDFGNYYFGSLFYLDNNFGINDYEHIELFNRKVRAIYSECFFLNYAPVPPPTLLFYIPFTFFSPDTAKLIFNLLGIFIFSISAARFVKQNNGGIIQIIVAPLVLLYPYYHCLVMGQTYFFIGALLIEIYLWNQKQKFVWCGLAISITVLLKLFPAFILFYFVLKRNYKVLGWFFFWLFISAAICFLFIDQNVLFHYYSKILPRMLANDAIGAFEITNQSLYTLLLKAFVYDKIYNPNPWLNIPKIVPVFESVLLALVFSILFIKKAEENLTLYSLVLLAGSLIGRYNPIYMQMMFFVPAFYFLKNGKNPGLIILFFIASHIQLFNHFFSIPFFNLGRIILYVALFLLSTVTIVDFKTLAKFSLFFLIPLILFKESTFCVPENNYFHLQNSEGVLYDMELRENILFLKSTLGSKEHIDSFVLEKKVSEIQREKKGDMFFLNDINKLKVLNGNIRKPIILNDSILIYLSDMNQGYGFYKIRQKRI